jgi:hypothetical protein
LLKTFLKNTSNKFSHKNPVINFPFRNFIERKIAPRSKGFDLMKFDNAEKRSDCDVICNLKLIH